MAGVGGNLTLDALVEMDAVELLDMRDAYTDMRATVATALAPYDHILDLIGRAISEKYSAAGQAALKKAGKTHGRVSVDIGDGLKLSAEIKNKVTWDQDKLKDAAKNMPWADVQHYFKIEFGVSEKIYKAIPPSSEFKKKLDDARTDKLGDIRVSLERKDAAPPPGG